MIWFYDRFGYAALILNKDGRFLTLTGNHIGFLHKNYIYNYKGKHCGWLENGIIRDMNGRVAGFSKEATDAPSPLLPLTHIPPIPVIPKIAPLLPLQEIPKLKPLKKFSWSAIDLTKLFV